MVYVNQKEIVRSYSVRYLGVTVDDKLSLSKHLKELALKLSKCCSLFYNTRDFVTKDMLNRIYCGFVYNRIPYELPYEVRLHKNNYM